MRRERPKMLTYRWEGHRDNIFESLHSMLDKESPVSGQVTNVTLVTNGGKVRAHQFILSAVSPYFRWVTSDQVINVIFFSNLTFGFQKNIFRFRDMATSSDCSRQNSSQNYATPIRIYLQRSCPDERGKNRGLLRGRKVS